MPLFLKTLSKGSKLAYNKERFSVFNLFENLQKRFVTFWAEEKLSKLNGDDPNLRIVELIILVY